jgi:CubicO group peptidase (beta-lactamase class C family)
MELSPADLQLSLEEALRKHHVPGASVAVFENGMLTAAAAGVTNTVTGVELTPDTVMHIGSITKVFTATLVMQLVDDGLVDLDEQVVRYLPDLRLRDAAALQQITVKMLLNHTSGIDGEMTPDYGHDEETIEQGVRRFADMGQLFSPGAEYSYSNAATIIAGYLAQRLRARSWYELMREQIFEPLRMQAAAVLPEEALLYRASVGHYLEPGSAKVTRTSHAFLPLSRAPCGSTSMMSARDLITFARAHMEEGRGPNGVRILSAESARAMQEVTVCNAGKHYTWDLDMGLGWMLAKDGWMTHAGGGPGIVSVVYACPARRWAAAILTNAAHGLNLISELMAPWLKARGGMAPLGTTETRAPIAPVSIDAARYVGAYEDICQRFIVTRTPRGLAMSREWKLAIYDGMSVQATAPATLMPLGDERFLLQSAQRDPLPEPFRVFTFRGSRSAESVDYLGWNERLYRRVA